MNRTVLVCGVALAGLVVAGLSKPAMAVPSECDAVSGNLVQNCGFETGNLANWAQSGNLGFTSVTSSPFFVHSGDFGLAEGPVGSDGFISQTLATVAGRAYRISVWYNPSGATPADFDIEWNGNTLLQVPNSPATGWTEYTVNAIGIGNDTLTISFRDDPSFGGIDDIVVTPEPGSLAVLSAALMSFGLWRRRNRKSKISLGA